MRGVSPQRVERNNTVSAGTGRVQTAEELLQTVDIFQHHLEAFSFFSLFHQIMGWLPGTKEMHCAGRAIAGVRK